MHVHGQNMNLGNRRRGRISITEVRTAEDAATRHGLHTIHLKPHAHPEQFFQALGYERVADPVTVGQRRLLGMVKKL